MNDSFYLNYSQKLPAIKQQSPGREPGALLFDEHIIQIGTSPD